MPMVKVSNGGTIEPLALINGGNGSAGGYTTRSYTTTKDYKMLVVVTSGWYSQTGAGSVGSSFSGGTQLANYSASNSSWSGTDHVNVRAGVNIPSGTTIDMSFVAHAFEYAILGC